MIWHTLVTPWNLTADPRLGHKPNVTTVRLLLFWFTKIQFGNIKQFYYPKSSSKGWEKKVNLNPSRPDPRQREKINLNFYFRTFLWRLKRFYESLLCWSLFFNRVAGLRPATLIKKRLQQKSLHNTWGTTKKCQYKNLS